MEIHSSCSCPTRASSVSLLTKPVWSDLPLSLVSPSQFVNQRLTSQPGHWRKGLGKAALAGKVLSWTLASMWGMTYMVGTYGPLYAPKTPGALMCSFEGLCRAHCGKEGKWMAAATGWPPLWAVHVVADAKLEAKAQVKKFEEELRLEQDMLVAALVASGLEDKVGE